MTRETVDDDERAIPVILVSNRRPVEHGRSDGGRTTKRGGGGLVTALSGLAGRLDDVVLDQASPPTSFSTSFS